MNRPCFPFLLALAASTLVTATARAAQPKWLPKTDAPNLPMGGGDEDGGHKTGEKAKRKKK